VSNNGVIASVKSEAFGGYNFDFYKGENGDALFGFNGTKSLIS
jgi:hypothetical protein